MEQAARISMAEQLAMSSLILPFRLDSPWASTPEITVAMELVGVARLEDRPEQMRIRWTITTAAAEVPQVGRVRRAAVAVVEQEPLSRVPEQLSWSRVAEVVVLGARMMRQLELVVIPLRVSLERGMVATEEAPRLEATEEDPVVVVVVRKEVPVAR